MEALAKLKGVVKPDGTVTAGNASGVNDGAVAILLANEAAAAKHGLTPRARVVGMATAGVAPRIMGIGPAPATRKVLELTGLKLTDIDVIELNEAFAAQALAVMRELGLRRRRPARQPERRRHRPRPSARRERGAARDHGHQPTAQERRPLCPLHDVHRGRARASRSSSSASRFLMESAERTGATGRSITLMSPEQSPFLRARLSSFTSLHRARPIRPDPTPSVSLFAFCPQAEPARAGSVGWGTQRSKGETSAQRAVVEGHGAEATPGAPGLASQKRITSPRRKADLSPTLQAAWRSSKRHVGALKIASNRHADQRGNVMSQSSIVGGGRAPQKTSGRGTDLLGPSDTSDSGSDIQSASRLKTDAEEGELGGATPVERDSDSDSMGTGERRSAVPGSGRDSADIRPDRIARSKDALDSAVPIGDDDDSIEALADDDIGAEEDEDDEEL